MIILSIWSGLLRDASARRTLWFPSTSSTLAKAARTNAPRAGEKARAIVVTMSDRVAWLFNLRGSDIDFNPVFFASAVVSPDSGQLFVDSAQINQDIPDSCHILNAFE